MINYSWLRKLFFWFFLISFIISTPIIIYYSLGYKFNTQSKKFQKTGAISIKTFPRDVDIFLDGAKIDQSTPQVLRGLLPKKYILTLEKKNFYPYTIPLEIGPSSVSEIDVTLIPKMRNMERLNLDSEIYKFFVLEHLLGKKIIAFTDKGVYFLDENFANAERIASLNMDRAVINTIQGLKEGKNQFVFWNQNNVWLIKTSWLSETKDASLSLVYQADDLIKGVFFALKQKYFIVHDGMNIVAIDAMNPSASFSILELKSMASEIFYDSSSDILYIRDKIPPASAFSLFSVNLVDLLYEKKTD